MELEKITQHGKDLEKRRFQDACGLAHGLELVGERWALLIVRELLLGPRRFSDLRIDLSGISANVLSQRLGELEKRGIVERVMLPAPARVAAYGLTPFGMAAEPMILAMSRWAMSSPAHDRMLPLNRVSMLLSLKTTIDMSRVGFLTAKLGFRFGDAAYRARLDRSGLVIEAGEDSWPELLYVGTPRGLARRLYGKASLEELEEQGQLLVTGDRHQEARFAALFSLPEKFPTKAPQE
jgi:DNA-binding HxlR family transcriptional regulator